MSEQLSRDVTAMSDFSGGLFYGGAEKLLLGFTPVLTFLNGICQISRSSRQIFVEQDIGQFFSGPVGLFKEPFFVIFRPKVLEI